MFTLSRMSLIKEQSNDQILYSDYYSKLYSNDDNDCYALLDPSDEHLFDI